MPEMIDIFAWLEQTGFATRIRQSLWLFPIIETIHLFGIVLLVGSTSALDVRLMGVAMRDQPVSRLAARLLPWAWTGFVIQIITGTLLFSSEATRCYTNPAFRYKMLGIALAGINALVFHYTSYRNVREWDEAPVGPLGAKIAGFASIMLWFGIVAAGRWIAFV